MLKNVFSGFTTAITGICKNAGKTTLLREIIQGETGRIALTSVGLDGERTDNVTATPKPSVYIKRGMLLVTAEGALFASDISKRILDVTDINTPMGRIVIAEALTGGYVLLAGASTYAETVGLRDKLKELGATHFYVDGAVSRRAFATTELCDSMALCVGASYSYDFAKILEMTEHTVKILTLPVASEGVEISGAVSDSVIQVAARNNRGKVLLCDDPGKLVFGVKTWGLLRATKNTLAVRKKAKLCVVSVNPYSAYGSHCDADKLLSEVRSIVPNDIAVCDIERGIII